MTGPAIREEGDGRIRVSLRPIGADCEIARGAALHEVLFPHGVEFPCGGHGQCRGCRVRVLEGSLPITAADRERLSDAEIDAGWRLACRAIATEDLALEVAQWEAEVLGDDGAFEFEPRPGVGIAIDLGTTTIVAQSVDLRTAEVLGVRTALNPQGRYGADLMSRIHFALMEDGEDLLRELVRETVGELTAELASAIPADRGDLRDIVLVGNTAMHHMFCGISVEPLSRYPFVTERDGLEVFRATSQLGWRTGDRDPRVRFLPCLGSFVGSDVLAGILATGLDRCPTPSALIDLGTNGEIVVAEGGDNGELTCASTAAGPAFEGARITMGMRAATGAVAEVTPRDDGGIDVGVLGGGRPTGLCGSGLVDAVAAGLDLGTIDASGRFTSTDMSSWTLLGSVELTQRDVRELQLAKAAIAAGVRLLTARAGIGPETLESCWLAGAFGNSIRRASARRIGLIEARPRHVTSTGNAALRGAKMALFSTGADDLWRRIESIQERCEHVELSADERFHDVYVEAMYFP